MDKDERYTLQSTLELCRRLARVSAYDVDVAAPFAPPFAIAPISYSAAENGLERPWYGNVWCNPPWSDVEPWVRKAWKEWRRPSVKSISMLLPANRTEQPWWQELVEAHRESSDLRARFLPGRQRYGTPEDPLAENQGSPPFGSVLLVWRDWA